MQLFNFTVQTNELFLRKHSLLTFSTVPTEQWRNCPLDAHVLVTGGLGHWSAGLWNHSLTGPEIKYDLTSFVLGVRHEGFLHCFRGDDPVFLLYGCGCGGSDGCDFGHYLEGLDHADVAEFLCDGQSGLSLLQTKSTHSMKSELNIASKNNWFPFRNPLENRSILQIIPC